MLNNLFHFVTDRFGDKVSFGGLLFMHDTGHITVDIHEDDQYYVAAFDDDGKFIEDFIALDEEELADGIAQYIG